MLKFVKSCRNIWNCRIFILKRFKAVLSEIGISYPPQHQKSLKTHYFTFVGALSISYNNTSTILFCVLVSAKQETADKRILKRFKAFHLNLGIVYPPTYKSAPKRFILRYFALSYILPVILRFTRYPIYLPTITAKKSIFVNYCNSAICKII